MPRFEFLIIILLFQLTFSQSAGEKTIHGKIVVVSGSAAGVTIVNLVNEKSAVSDHEGEFSILAKAEDLLVFSSVNLEYHRKIIDESDLTPEVVIIKMTAKITELDEVIVNKHPEINAVLLGISPKGIVHRTPMERKLYTAGDFKPIHLLGLLGGSLAVDPILNAINGRTAMLKKSIEIEKKIRSITIINALFDENYFTNNLDIPDDYVQGFQYFCAEDKILEEALKTKNRTKIEFLIVPLATKYKGFIAEITQKP